MTTDTSVSRAGTNGSVPEDTSPVPDSWGINRFTDDGALQRLLPLYLSQDLYDHLLPQFESLGARLGGELDDLAHQADQHPPVLQHRTRRGEAQRETLDGAIEHGNNDQGQQRREDQPANQRDRQGRPQFGALPPDHRHRKQPQHGRDRRHHDRP